MILTLTLTIPNPNPNQKINSGEITDKHLWYQSKAHMRLPISY